MLTTTNYAAPHCAIFSISGYYCPLRYKYSPQHPIRKHLQTTAVSWGKSRFHTLQTNSRVL